MGSKPTVCNYCGEPGSRTRRVVKGVDGIRSHAQCRPPEYRKAQAKAWQDANPEKVAGYKAQWYARTAEQRRAKAKAYREALTPDERRERRLRSQARHPGSYRHSRRVAHLRRYGLTHDEYEQMSADQGHKCAICGLSETAKRRNGAPMRLAVDHNHDTGVVRQLLCQRCNLLVGVIESAGRDVLAAVDEYLEVHSGGR